MTSLQASHVALLLFVAVAAVLLNPSDSRSINLPSPQCHPSIIDSMPVRIKKICEALTSIWEFSDAMENYLDEKGQSLSGPPGCSGRSNIVFFAMALRIF